MSIFSKIRTNTDERTAEVVEIISDLRCPLVTEKEAEAARCESQGSSSAADATGSSSFLAGSSSVAATPKQQEKVNEEENRRKQVEMAKMRVQLNILKNDLDEAVQNKDFIKAQQLKLDMELLDTEHMRLQDELTEAAAMAAKPTPQVEEKEKVSQPTVATQETER